MPYPFSFFSPTTAPDEAVCPGRLPMKNIKDNYLGYGCRGTTYTSGTALELIRK